MAEETPRKPQKKRTPKARTPAKLTPQTAQPRDVVHQLNRTFIERRISDGKWQDDNRGSGVYQCLLALDTMWTQVFYRSVPISYPLARVREDLDFVLGHVESHPPEFAYPLTSDSGAPSSPEVAGYMMRVLVGTRRRLKQDNAWDTEIVRTRFESVTTLALDFIEQSANPDGGWGHVGDGSSLLFPTTMVTRALCYLRDDPDLIKSERLASVTNLIKRAKRYLDQCFQEDRYCRSAKIRDSMELYSAYATLAYHAIYDMRSDSTRPSQKGTIDFQKHVNQVLNNFRTTGLPSMVDSRPSAINENVESLNKSGREVVYKMEDNAGRWPWLHAIMLWMHSHPPFFSDHWQLVADEILADELRRPNVASINLWNRITVALTAYDKFSVSEYRTTNYGLRRHIHELFNEETMAQKAYEYIERSLKKVSES